MAHFFAGMITMGFAISALFFLRFWWRTNDRLFLAFSCAFLLFALNQGMVTSLGSTGDQASIIYLLRLLGFALIIWAIVVKNIRSKTG